MRQIVEKFMNLLKVGRVSGGYKPITRDSITRELAAGWRDPAIPSAQRSLVDMELAAMYKGKIVSPYQVLADAVKFTNCDAGRIIEVGCASGYYREVLSHLLGKEIRYTGIDYSNALISEARRRYPGIPFIVGDATDLPVAGEACDILISGCVLLHVPEYRKAISESFRASREWVIFHRTPVLAGETVYFSKRAYGVFCVEIIFGEGELYSVFREYGGQVVAELEISRKARKDLRKPVHVKTYVCRK